MPHLALGILVMLVGAAVMAAGLYVRSARTQGRALASVASSAILLFLGLAIAVAGIIVSFETNAIR